MLATSSEVWRRPSSCRECAGGSGTGTKALPRPSPVRSSACLPSRPPRTEVGRNWTSSNKHDRYWKSRGNLHIGVSRPTKRGTVPGGSSDPGCGARSLGQGVPRLWRAMERALASPALKHQKVCDMHAVDARRADSLLRTQPKTKNLRQAAGFRQRPACQWRYSLLPARPGGVRQVVRNALSGAGPGQRPFPVRLRCDPLRISRFGRHATRLVVIGQVPISADVIGIFSGDWMLDCLRRRHMGLFPAV